VSAGEYIRKRERGTRNLAVQKRGAWPYSCERVRILIYSFLELPVRAAFYNAGGRGKLPIYEYRCSRGHQYERAEGFEAPSEHRCPSCSGRSRRLISLPAVIFKGSGFYSTDNRKSSLVGDGGGSPPSSGDGPSHDSGSESKAEAKTAD